MQLWHGGTLPSYHGDLAVQPGKRNRCELGPGIYLTTNYGVARTYGRKQFLLSLPDAADIRWLNGASAPVETLLAMVQHLPRGTHRKALTQQLRAEALRRNSDSLPIEYLVNVCVNNDWLVGATGPVLAKLLVDAGIDAARHHFSAGSGGEVVVVFNPRIIKRIEQYRLADVTAEIYDQVID